MSSVPTSDLIIVGARAAEYSAVLNVLQDWSALDLVGDVTLVNVDAVRQGDVRIPCASIVSGGIRPGVLQDELASREASTARVAAISRIGRSISAIPAENALALVEHVTRTFPALDVRRVHIVGVTVSDEGGLPNMDQLAWMGWHNVLVAPEHARSAGAQAGVSPLVYEPSSPTALLQLVACLCSLAGLWKHEPTAAVENLAVAPGRVMTLVRSFTCHLDADAVEADLIERLSSTAGGYPVPLLDGSLVEIIEDEVGAAAAMSHALETKHAYVFASERAVARTSPRQHIGAMALVKMFFSFLWHALKNAPRAFVDRVVYEASQGTAAAVDRAVFGKTDPAFKVVVNGIGPDGRPATWDEFEAALDQVDARSEQRTDVVQHAPADLSQLWRDFVRGGMTLVDAGNRTPDLPCQMVGSSRGIVVNPGRIAPNPSEPFEVSNEIAPYVNRSSVAPTDMLGARDLFEQLGTVGARAPHLVGASSKSQSALRQFFEQRETSYVGRFGRRIVEDLVRCRKELVDYDDHLLALQAAATTSDDLQERQRRLGRTLKIALFLALGCAAISILVAVLGLVGVLALVLLLSAITLCWFGSSVLIFAKGQAALFALLNRRKSLGDQEAVLRQNAQAARQDLRRLGRAYRQYLDWAQAFGTFVTSPLGTPKRRTVTPLLLGTSFPRNHRFGSADADPHFLEPSVIQFRNAIFGVGWMTEAWDAFVADVPDIGEDRLKIAERPDVLYTDPAISQHSLLSAWSDGVATRSWDGGADALRERVAAVLDADRTGLANSLLARVHSRGPDGRVVSSSLDEFLRGVDDEAGSAGHLFQRSIFSESAEVSNAWNVTHHVSASSSHGLGRTVVLTEFSGGFSAYDLKTEDGAAPRARLGQVPAQVPVEAPEM